jgi:hypothetical protein
MKHTTTTATVRRPNRILIALAAAWMLGALALGGVVSGQQPTTEAAGPAQLAADEASLP